MEPEVGVESTDVDAGSRPLRRLRRGTEDEETCVICFSWPKRKATLDGCTHTSFCLACITTWAETNNCCPVCRTRFTVVSDPVDPSCHIPVEHAEPQAQLGEEEEEWAGCTLCHERDREDRVLLCDGCDRGWHLWCLRPALYDIPDGQWFCASCKALGARAPPPQRVARASTAAGDASRRSTAPYQIQRRRALPDRRAGGGGRHDDADTMREQLFSAVISRMNGQRPAATPACAAPRRSTSAEEGRHRRSRSRSRSRERGSGSSRERERGSGRASREERGPPPRCAEHRHATSPTHARRASAPPPRSSAVPPPPRRAAPPPPAPPPPPPPALQPPPVLRPPVPPRPAASTHPPALAVGQHDAAWADAAAGLVAAAVRGRSVVPDAAQLRRLEARLGSIEQAAGSSGDVRGSGGGDGNVHNGGDGDDGGGDGGGDGGRSGSYGGCGGGGVATNGGGSFGADRRGSGAGAGGFGVGRSSFGTDGRAAEAAPLAASSWSASSSSSAATAGAAISSSSSSPSPPLPQAVAAAAAAVLDVVAAPPTKAAVAAAAAATVAAAADTGELEAFCVHVRRLARGWLAERGGRVGGWRVSEAKLEAAVRRAGAKLLLHYGSVARFVDGGGSVDGALRPDREERIIRLLEGYMHAKGR